MKKILVIRFSSIGDIVLTTPVVRCIKEQTNAQIHYLTKKSFAQMMENNPYVDTVHSFETENIKDILQDASFDLIVDLHFNLRTAKVKKWLDVPEVHFSKLNFKKWLLVNLKWDLMGNSHVVDRYLATVASLGVKPDGKGLDYFIPEKDHLTREELPELCRADFLTFVIGGQHDGKMMSVEKIARICNGIAKPMVLLGGPDDVARGQAIEKLTGNHTINLAGKYNLNQSASILQWSKAVLSHDTGLMHIASAFGKNIISLWGGTVPALGFAPYKPGPASVMIGAAHVMRPSSKLGRRKGIYRLFDFMNMIDEAEVIQHAITLYKLP